MTSPDDVDLDRVWTNVAAEVWRRHPGWLERTAAKLLRSPGLARALLTTPSLLVPWLIASAVVLAVGALAQAGAGQPLVWLIAPAVAAVGVAYAYGPGIDPAWELCLQLRGQRPDGAADPRRRGVRGERRARPGGERRDHRHHRVVPCRRS